MSEIQSDLAAGGYQVAIPVFEGPLDLLLHLIQRAELDITKVAIARVTDQYLAYLKQLQERSADEVSAFLVIAAKLIQIKSEALLPRPPVREEGEEDPGEALARQLRIYKRFKEISNWLGERESDGLRSYVRLAPPPKVEGKLVLDGLTASDLRAALREALSRQGTEQEIGRVVVAPVVTIRDTIKHIIDRVRQAGKATFLGLLGHSRTRVEIVVTFLAVLELVKSRRVRAAQAGLFREIEIEPSDEWDEDTEFELEFLD